MQMPHYHTPIMLEEVIGFLKPEAGRVYLDGTLGTGGHAEALLARSAPTGRVVGIDADAESIEIARERLAPYGDRILFVHGRYEQARSILLRHGLSKVHGVVLDLGISRVQLESSERGFSFSREGPLDMRMDRTSGDPASRFLERLPEEDMVHLFRTYGEERWARRIARAIVRRRGGEAGDISTTRELVDIILRALPRQARRARIHPATRVFMALRIAVNRELESLEEFLEELPDLLHRGGRFCVLAFHSLEDRIVKQRLRAWEQPYSWPVNPGDDAGKQEPLFRRVRKKVLRPTEEEVMRNPLSRSAKLRVAERL
jgi:16S rRNA (cytosine1402-N4)-methyltransferase